MLDVTVTRIGRKEGRGRRGEEGEEGEERRGRKGEERRREEGEERRSSLGYKTRRDHITIHNCLGQFTRCYSEMFRRRNQQDSWANIKIQHLILRLINT